MKRFIAVLLALVLFVGGATMALAAQKWVIPQGGSLDGDTFHVGTFITSTLTEPEKNFMREWLASDSRILLSSQYKPSFPTFFCFIILDDYKGVSDLEFKILNTLPTLDVLCSSRFLTFEVPADAGSVDVEITRDRNSSVVTYLRSSGGRSQSFNTLILCNVAFDPALNDYYVDSDYVSITDDNGLLGGDAPDPDPSEPEPPEVDPPIVIPPAEPPKIPGGMSQYVPYDTAVWDDFVLYIRDCAGSVVNILLLVLAPLTIIGVVVSLLKHYFSNGKHNGGESV